MRKDIGKKHIFMVQSRESEASIAEKIEDGREDLIDREWTDSLEGPVWFKRAKWHAKEIEGKFTETRVIQYTETGIVRVF